MQTQLVKITSFEFVTHNVLQVVTEKPTLFNFNSGQAAEVSINKDGWQKDKRPLTFTCIPENNYLEFTIKIYPKHRGVTNELLNLKINDELILHGVFGDIGYKGEGIFIAGGAGVTPFISILRNLQSKNEIGNNKLIFANKTKADIILEQEFRWLLGKNFINVLSEEKAEGYENGYITEDFLKTQINDLNKVFYLCGPPQMMDEIENQLERIHVNKKLIVRESFKNNIIPISF